MSASRTPAPNIRHRAYLVLERVCVAWCANREQRDAQINQVLIALAEHDLLNGAELPPGHWIVNQK